jgi:uncharacterized protein YjbI with pentapeptide repeats
VNFHLAHLEDANFFGTFCDNVDFFESDLRGSNIDVIRQSTERLYKQFTPERQVFFSRRRLHEKIVNDEVSRLSLMIS